MTEYHSVNGSKVKMLFNLPWQLLFDFVLAEFLDHLHVFAEKHHMNGASHTEYIGLIGPLSTLQHLWASESIGLNNLLIE